LSHNAAALAAVLVASLVASTVAVARDVSLAILNVTVVDPETRSVKRDQNLYIDGGRIVALTASSARNEFVPASTLDGQGRYLIPGLMDMHVHAAGALLIRPTFTLLLANGVTAIRDMSADCRKPEEANAFCIEHYRALAHQIETGQLAGPRPLVLASAVIVGPTQTGMNPGAEPVIIPSNADDGRRLADYLKARGVDVIKVYDTVPRDAYFALLEAAKGAHIEVSGHLPSAVSVIEASQAGQRTLEHARDIPIHCSRYGAEFQRTMQDVVSGLPGAKRPDTVTRLSRTIHEFDLALCREVLATLARNRTYYVPTHVTREFDARASEPAYRDDPNLQYVPRFRRESWQEDLDSTARSSAEKRAWFRKFLDHGLRITQIAHDAGVRVMVGTDANDTMIIPGFSMHHEMELLARGGLQPMDILRAATTVPAEYLGRTRELGGIAPGKLADLVLLDADPTQKISNTRTIAAVILGGRVFDRSALDAMLEDSKQ
jgi:hypothetical protein